MQVIENRSSLYVFPCINGAATLNGHHSDIASFIVPEGLSNKSVLVTGNITGTTTKDEVTFWARFPGMTAGETRGPISWSALDNRSGFSWTIHAVMPAAGTTVDVQVRPGGADFTVSHNATWGESNIMIQEIAN